MGNRVALLLAGGALALLGAWWIAGSAGREPAAAPALVVVSATEYGNGNWARYSISVHNAGDVPFAGTLVLLTGNGATTTGGVSGVPGQLPNAVPQLPASAPDAGYQLHVELLPHRERELAITAPPRYAVVAVAQDPGGGLVASAPVQRSPAAAIAVLSRSSAVVDQLTGVRFDDATLHVTQFADARAFPSSALGLAGYVAVVIDQFDAGSLSGAQRQALSDFVAQGGGLVTAGGRDWRQTLGALPADLSGLRPLASATASVTPLLALAGRAGQDTTEVAISEPSSSRVLVTSPEGTPLIAAADRGSGVVIGLAYDPAALPTADGAAAAGWTAALAPAVSHPAGPLLAAHSVPAIDPNLALSLAPPPGAALPSPWLVGPLVLAYLLSVVPVNYLVLRRRGRPDRLWMTAPLIAAVFAAGFYWLGLALQADLQVSALQVLRVVPGSVSAVEYERVLFTHRGDHSASWSAPALAAPLTDQLALLGCGDRCGLTLTGLRSGEEHVVPATRPGVIEHGVVYGGERVFGAAFISHDPIGVEAHLVAAGDRVVGDISNRGRRAVTDLVIYVPVSDQILEMPVPGTVAPGRLIAVDGQLRSAQAAAGGGDAAGLRRQLGAAAARLGGAWLVGGVDPLPSPIQVDGRAAPGSMTAVFEQQVPLARATGSLAGLAPTRLVATAGERTRGGFTDVYDLEVPPGASPALGLSYQAALYGSGVEVFDWRAGTWRNSGFVDDAAGTGSLRRLLSAAEVAPAASGQPAAVRVRVAEPRIGWGAGISLFGA